MTTNQKNNLHEDKLNKIKQVIPEAFQDGKLNIEELQHIFEGYLTEDEYHYAFNWRGKNDAKRGAYIPTSLTLKPNLEKSVDFETTKNLYIEGDNLEVLKIMRDSYAEKVDVIYIDPPYNTGNEFVYSDDFEDSYAEYKKLVDIEDEEGKVLTTNKDTSGRKHTNWLNMMYPRLLLVKDFLSDDGVIFISIDDNEQANLKKMCDEIFGEANFLAQVIWERAYAPVNLKKNFSESHDYILVYAKNIQGLETNGIPRSDQQTSTYINPDNDPRGPYKPDNFSVGPAVEKNIYEIITPSGRKVFPPEGYSWRYSKRKYQELLKENRVWFGETGNNVPAYKRFLSEVKLGVTPMTIWKYEDVGHSQNATQGLKKLMGDKSYFDYPKPVGLIKRVIELYSKPNSIIMDFFSGSSTTAQAVMEKNAEDQGNRKYIMVQLPEPLDEKSTAYKDGYKSIAEIAQERIQRAAAKIETEIPEAVEHLDTGFKVFELTETNFPQWDENLNEEELTKQLDLLSTGINNELDAVYELLLLLKVYLLDEEVKSIFQDIYSIGDEEKTLITVHQDVTSDMYDWLLDNHKGYSQVVIYDNALDQEQKTNLLGNLGDKLTTV